MGQKKVKTPGPEDLALIKKKSGVRSQNPGEKNKNDYKDLLAAASYLLASKI